MMMPFRALFIITIFFLFHRLIYLFCPFFMQTDIQMTGDKSSTKKSNLYM